MQLIPQLEFDQEQERLQALRRRRRRHQEDAVAPGVLEIGRQQGVEGLYEFTETKHLNFDGSDTLW